MVWLYCLSSEVLKGYSLFLIYKTNIFIKLLKLNANVVIFFCYSQGIQKPTQLIL